MQREKDTRHQLILSQIALVYQELVAISGIEMQKKLLSSESRLNEIEKQREQLANLLYELNMQKVQREKQLHLQIKQMEESEQRDEENFWLIQYQILLESQPIFVQMDLLGFDSKVKNILLNISKKNPDIPLSRYLQNLAQISYEQLQTFSARDLYESGINDHELCKQIYNQINEPKDDVSTTKDKDKDIDVPKTVAVDIRLWCQWECVVCLDEKSEIVFLPCGHVCTCAKCSQSISDCPMCRAHIQGKFEIDPLIQSIQSNSDI